MSTLILECKESIDKCDYMSFTYDSKKFAIQKAGTTASIVIAYIIDKEKEPKIHAGILFSGNGFLSNGKKHDYALFHRLYNCFVMETNNDRDTLMKKLRVYESDKHYTACVPLGKVMTPVSTVIKAINKTLKAKFNMQDMAKKLKEHVKRGEIFLLDGSTNCLDTAMKLALSMDITNQNLVKILQSLFKDLQIATEEKNLQYCFTDCKGHKHFLWSFSKSNTILDVKQGIADRMGRNVEDLKLFCRYYKKELQNHQKCAQFHDQTVFFERRRLAGGGPGPLQRSKDDNDNDEKCDDLSNNLIIDNPEIDTSAFDILDTIDDNEENYVSDIRNGVSSTNSGWQ